MKKSLLVFISIITFSLSYSQEWKSIEEQGDEEIYIKLHTKTSAWIKKLNAEVPVDFDKYGMDKTEKGDVVFLYRFDCSEGKLGVLAFIYYNQEGEVLHSEQYREVFVDMVYPFPDTVGEFYLKTFCELE